MATLTVSLTGFTPSSRTISASDLTKLQNAITAKMLTEGNGNPTNQQIFDYVATSFFTALVETVKQAEREKAAAMVQNISLT
jgi:hypothetical protein